MPLHTYYLPLVCALLFVTNGHPVSPQRVPISDLNRLSIMSANPTRHLAATFMSSPLAGWRLVRWVLLSGVCTLALLQYNQLLYTYTRQEVPPHITKALDRCRSLTLLPGPPADFHARSASDRFEAGTNPTVIPPRLCRGWPCADICHAFRFF